MATKTRKPGGCDDDDSAPLLGIGTVSQLTMAEPDAATKRKIRERKPIGFRPPKKKSCGDGNSSSSS